MFCILISAVASSICKRLIAVKILSAIEIMLNITTKGNRRDRERMILRRTIYHIRAKEEKKKWKCFFHFRYARVSFLTPLNIL